MRVLSQTEPAPADDRDERWSGNEFAFTKADFHRIADILRADSGIALTETKAPLVYGRLVKRIRALKLESFHAYCDFVATAEGAGERKKMTAALTTNITRFFREPHHFEHLKRQVLPRLAAKARDGGRVRLWSAGCSSGEEPYSIALTILSMLPEAAKCDIRILASDINTDMLRIGREGIYSEAALSPVEPALCTRWFAPHASPTRPRSWIVGKPLRDLVSFRELNLMDPWPMAGKFDVIFCRNTVIYFEQDAQAQVWRQIDQHLAPDGLLYIGHSERLSDVEGFKVVGPTTYQRVETT